MSVKGVFKSLKVGEKFINKQNLEYEIIKCINGQTRRIKFLKSGHEQDVRVHSIKDNTVKDPLNPSIYNIGVIGDKIKNASKHILYNRWKLMLDRCYNTNSKSYKFYGEKGVKVCDRWHRFDNFVEDISKKENYEKLLLNPNKWQIDKDKSTQKIYSNETTIIITKTENVKIRNEQNGNPAKEINKNAKAILKYTLDGKLVGKYNTVKQAAKSINRSDNTVRDCAKGRTKTAGGYIFRYVEI